MNEFWGLSIQAFSNTPFWSIAYEGWYYILFGVYVFWSGVTRRAALVLVGLVAGPEILLLFPVWLMGVHLQRADVWRRMGVGTALIVFAASNVLIVVFHWVDLAGRLSLLVGSVVGRDFQLERMTFLGGFLGDYVLGGLVALNFGSFRQACQLLGRPLVAMAGPIRFAASFTFSLYLFHRPLLLMWTAIVDGDPRSSVFLLVVILLVAISVVVLAMATERRKDWYKAKTAAAFDLLAKRLTPTSSGR